MDRKHLQSLGLSHGYMAGQLKLAFSYKHSFVLKINPENRGVNAEGDEQFNRIEYVLGRITLGQA